MIDDSHGQAQNTDRELWREREGDYYADSIFVTERGCIGINCGGHCYIMPLQKWHDLAAALPTHGDGELVEKLKAASHTEIFHGSGAQRSIALDKAIQIVREHYTKSPVCIDSGEK